MSSLLSGRIHVMFIGGQVHQSRWVNPNMYAQKWMDIRISQSKDQHIAKNTKSDGCKMLNRRHK